MKSTLKEIEERFDQDVERFSNLETGQQTTLDATFNMELITTAIAKRYPKLKSLLDIGCGAGNYPVKLLQKVETAVDVTLVDLSQSMLDRALTRVQAGTTGSVTTIKGDFCTADLEERSFDVIIATAVLHHLRDDKDWETAFKKLYSLLREGGSLWIFDLVFQQEEQLQELVYKNYYGHYLSELKDDVYRDHVFSYIEKEDSPRDLMYQLDLLKSVGFTKVDILHKNLCFASFVGIKFGL